MIGWHSLAGPCFMMVRFRLEWLVLKRGLSTMPQSSIKTAFPQTRGSAFLSPKGSILNGIPRLSLTRLLHNYKLCLVPTLSVGTQRGRSASTDHVISDFTYYGAPHFPVYWALRNTDRSLADGALGAVVGGRIALSRPPSGP